MNYSDTQPIREFAKQRGISPTKVYAWIDSGEIDSFLIGHRRHVIVASYERLVRRLMKHGPVKLPSSNPKAKARTTAASVPSMTGPRRAKSKLDAR
jgi:hypothetical protein